jgi:hypothetical protein
MPGTGELLWRASRLHATPLCRNEYQNLGQMGKRNLKRILGSFGMAVCGLLTAVLAGACEADLGEPLQSGRVLKVLGLQGRWIGSVVPTENACGPATQALMSIGKSGFGLDPFQSTTVIYGKIDEEGRLSGRLNRLSAEHQDLSIVFEGRATGSDAISGTLESGRCHWTMTLHRG